MRLAGLCLLVGCAADPSAPPGVDAPATIGDAQLPPQGHAALRGWLDGGAYRAWACEPAPHPARPPGAHGANRICSNALLSRSGDGAFPPGAASVKELYRDGAISGYAVGIKLDGSGASSWYWYEAVGSSVVADGVGRTLCAGCHRDAPRDHVFTRVE